MARRTMRRSIKLRLQAYVVYRHTSRYIPVSRDTTCKTHGTRSSSTNWSTLPAPPLVVAAVRVLFPVSNASRVRILDIVELAQSSASLNGLVIAQILINLLCISSDFSVIIRRFQICSPTSSVVYYMFKLLSISDVTFQVLSVDLFASFLRLFTALILHP